MTDLTHAQRFLAERAAWAAHDLMHEAYRDDRHQAAVDAGLDALAQWPGAADDDAAFIACSHATIGVASLTLEDLRAAWHHLTIATEPDRIDQSTFLVDYLAVITALTGLKQGRYQRVDELLDLVIAAGTPDRQAMAMRIRATAVWRSTGELAEASAWLERSVLADPAVEAGVWWQDAAYRTGFLFDAGRPREALAFGIPGLEQQRRLLTGTPATNGPEWADYGVALTQVGRAHVAAGDVERGRPMLDEAAGYLQGRWYGQAYVELGLAEAAFAVGDLTAGHEALDRCGQIVDALDLRPTRIDLDLVRAEGLLADGDRRRAVTVLDGAADLASALGHVSDLRRIERLRADHGC